MPWGKLDDGLYDHPKLADLPSDQEACEAILATLEPDQVLKLAAIGLWTRAVSWSNRYLTDGQTPRAQIRKLDGSPALANALVGAGLFEDTPAGYAVHDFLDFNPSRAEVLKKRAEDKARQADYRAKKQAERDADEAGKNGAPKRHGVTNAVTPRSNAPTVTPSDDRDTADPSQQVSQRDSPAGARSANPDPTRPDPTQESLRRGSRAPRADIAALHGRGWKRVTKGQRRVLDEVLARHDVTGPEFAAEAIRRTPADKDPLEAVMAADRAWQDAQRRRAEAEETAWAATKQAEAEAVPDWMRPPVETPT